jgi:hypothetical protein
LLADEVVLEEVLEEVEDFSLLPLPEELGDECLLQ